MKMGFKFQTTERLSVDSFFWETTTLLMIHFQLCNFADCLHSHTATLHLKIHNSDTLNEKDLKWNDMNYKDCNMIWNLAFSVELERKSIYLEIWCWYTEFHVHVDDVPKPCNLLLHWTSFHFLELFRFSDVCPVHDRLPDWSSQELKLCGGVIKTWGWEFELDLEVCTLYYRVRHGATFELLSVGGKCVCVCVCVCGGGNWKKLTMAP